MSELSYRLLSPLVQTKVVETKEKIKTEQTKAKEQKYKEEDTYFRVESKVLTAA